MNFVTKYFLKTIKKTFILAIILTILFVLWFWTGSDKENDKSPIPVILWWTTGFPGTEEIRKCPNKIICIVSSNNIIEDRVNSYLFYASNIDFNNLPLPRKDVIWGLYHEESPRNVEELSHEETLILFNYSSTFSRHSDVPFPLQYLESVKDITSTKFFIPTQNKNSFKDIAPIMYLQTDCETATERDKYVEALMRYIKVDSYGGCLKNKQMPARFVDDYLNRLNDDDFLHFIARYKFVLAIENGVCDDYITEKLWRAIKVGTVPIYFGSPTVKDWLPHENSAILLEDYPTPKLLSDYLKRLDNDNNLYERHLQHKTKQLISNMRLLNELKLRPYQTDALKVAEEFECFICKKLHEQKLGKVIKSVVNKLHYNCPQPVSALTLNVNPNNDWIFSWQTAATKAKEIKQRVLG
ncbi:alpha-(1,3)-fucosyltransferase 10 [Pieris napi]|uniref:alpha-(1,3)-fucosyltransferase 10 n=1 Tax=Pieris napi TaxID=78633 RepID=UPI001FBA608D|nr:alpha-(1,3)-fucosyltransferase 10 [Pieris napi]